MIQGLTHICLVTNRIDLLRDFYQKILEIEPENYSAEYSEFVLPGARLSLFSQERQERIAPGSTKGDKNASTVLEFQVESVDLEHQRIRELGAQIIKAPTDYPWGVRSFYFEDPARNLINFYQI
ncbi:MAG: VOC family protein [Verrucomicrobiota bacterium]